MKIRAKVSAIAISVCMALTAMPVAAFAGEAVKGTAARINVQGERAAAYMVVSKEFAAKDQDVKLVYNAGKQAGDIIVDTQGDGYEAVYGAEGYGIEDSRGIITVKAAGANGAAYGLRDVLKQLEGGEEIEEKLVCAPAEDIRALFVDCARKYFSVEWFESIIREMAWNGMNTLYMSFSNDEGFRFLLDDMGVSFDNGSGSTVEYDHEFMKHLGDNPHTINDSAFLAERNEGADDVAQGIRSYDNDKYLTQDDMVKILTYAKAYGINVIPEFNSPGHTGQLLWYFPEYRNIGIWGIDGNPCYALDLENQEAKNFTAALIKKYVDFFQENGCTGFCVGGDEFAAHGTTNETIAEYVNGLVDYVEEKGMTAYAWVDGQAGESRLLKKSVIVNDWKSRGAAASDYQVVNFNSDFMYYVLKSYDWTVKPKQVFEQWHPLLFNGNSAVEPGSAAAENVRGACMAIWCDDAAAKTTDTILTDMMTDIKAFGYRVWNYDPDAENTVTYEDFIAKATSAAAVDEADVLGVYDALKEISSLEKQLKEADKKVFDAQTAVTNAQGKLAEAEGRVTAAEQKVAAAVDAKGKLMAEAELCTAYAETNKLAAETALKKAEAAKKKAEAVAIEAKMIALDGNAQDAAAKRAESENLEKEAVREESTAQAKQSAQAELDKAVEAKKTELLNYKEPPKTETPAPVTTTTVKKVNYKILDAGKKTAAVTGAANKKLKDAVIGDTVRIDGVVYKVTQINSKAFKGLKDLKSVVIGKNVKKINKEAFAGCSKLSKINMKKAKGISTIGKKAFSKINSKAKVTVPAKKKAKYKNMLKEAGLPKKAGVK